MINVHFLYRGDIMAGPPDSRRANVVRRERMEILPRPGDDMMMSITADGAHDAVTGKVYAIIWWAADRVDCIVEPPGYNHEARMAEIGAAVRDRIATGPCA